ncbi:MAG: hypothetical protein P9M13_07485 [Candidatus Ancaeobacter aquaticus]|nr:hypothetical protein [Candidatus Ancaeobacter aquaticus]
MITRGKVLEEKLEKKLDGSGVTKINKRLNRLKKESTWTIKYKWDKKIKRLYIQTAKLYWEVIFKEQKCEVYAEWPTLMMPFLLPAKKKVISILKEEIGLLNL